MTTKQGTVVTAFSTLMRLSQKPMNSFIAYKFFRLKKALKDVVDFQSEQEHKLVEEMGGTINDAGQILFTGEDMQDKYQQYRERHKELEVMECEINTEKITVYLKELPEISPADFDALDEFIEWKEK